MYWSITSAFEAIQVQTALHDSQFIFLLRLNVCNDLAKAMKALDGKKRHAETRDPPSQDPRDHMAEAVKA